MDPAGTTICLNMIVKNESPVIQRCLQSVRGLIDSWVIVDTGSTDGTQALVRQTLDGLPGELFERPWVDFAHNRSEALRLARSRGDYTLIIDADDTLEVSTDLTLPKLTCDSYTIQLLDLALRYRRTQLVRNTLPWRYEGVLHEFLTVEGATSEALLNNVYMRRNHDGARRRDKETYRRDVEVLETALAGDISDFLRSRYTFYLAQSYRDCGEKEKALEHYLKRSDLGFWDQERFISLYHAAQIKGDLGHPVSDVIATYERATTLCPFRAEALHGASRFCRFKDMFAEGYQLAQQAAAVPMPENALFEEPWIYEYGILDELAVSGYWSGHYWESLDASLKMLETPSCPAEYRPRILANARGALWHLRPPSDPQPSRVIDHWVPSAPAGGTEIMSAALRTRLGGELERVNLQLNLFDPSVPDERPLVVWFHHDVNQPAVQWCHDAARLERVARFVFVSYWQMARYLDAFPIPVERCVVLENAVEIESGFRPWRPGPVWRCAYVATPFRGLSVLLDAWETLPANTAELHIWSSMKLYGQATEDVGYRHLYDRAQALAGIVYHGLAPNAELRGALRDMHFLTYPNIFEETSCLSVIEAMAAGCRVIVPEYGALPETTSGYARMYPFVADEKAHANRFRDALLSELSNPWGGDDSLCTAQQAHCVEAYDWQGREKAWRDLMAGF